MKRMLGAAALGLGLLAVTAPAQDMMRDVDLSSPDMVSADMTRSEVEAALAAANVAAPADFNGKRLSSLDLSGAIFRAARLNKKKLVGAKLNLAVLDQAWLLEADLTGASLRGANPFASQMLRARLDGADLASAKLSAPIGLDQTKNFDKAKNRDRWIRE